MKQASFRSAQWIRTLVVTLALALVALAAPTLGRQDIPELPKPDGSGDTPEISISLVDNSTLKLSSLRGKVVLLDFFWSQCMHCQQHTPHIVELYNQFSKRGLNIVGLADPRDTKETAQAYMKQMKIAYPVGLTNLEVIAYYIDSHDHSVPQMVLFGADGKMVRRWIGWGENSKKELSDVLEEQLKKAEAKSSTKPN